MGDGAHHNNKTPRKSKHQGGVLRAPSVVDAASILTLKMGILQGNVYDALLPEEYAVSVQDEATWLKESLQNPNHFIVVCAVEEAVVGVLYFQASAEKRCQHWGEFGMGIAKKWRGQGFGTQMINALCAWVEEHPTLEKVCLKVFAANEGAHKLYQRLGFEEEGRLKKCLKLGNGLYTDAILMAKFIKNKNGRKDDE